LRLHNLSPLPGSRRKPTRKGRGYGAGQGGTCGFGMRGQKARGGRGTRPGFEGGQTPMYRRFPKLKGIAGGMSAGKPKFVTVNVSDLAQALADSRISAGQDIDLDTLKSVGLIKASGYYRDLPLKVLGDGEISAALKIKAASFSASASEKLVAAGGEATLVEGRKAKWSRDVHEANVAAAAPAAAAKSTATKKK
jgi:large subunit ribosomal protein L15